MVFLLKLFVAAKILSSEVSADSDMSYVPVIKFIWRPESHLWTDTNYMVQQIKNKKSRDKASVLLVSSLLFCIFTTFEMML